MIKYTTKDFIIKAAEIHKNKYDYSLVNYINSKTKIKIICPEHGIFEQTPKNHLAGKGCKKCALLKNLKNKRADINYFINKAIKIYGDKYDYSQTKYINYRTPVKIICPEHGAFYQKPANHLKGEGCPFCKGSYGEQIIFWLLKTIFNEEFKFQWKNSFCKNQLCLPFDFYLPKRNMVIEFMGEQHYKFCSFFYRTIKEFHKRRHIDWLKRKFCYDSDIIYYKIDYNENIYDKLKEIFYE